MNISEIEFFSEVQLTQIRVIYALNWRWLYSNVILPLRPWMMFLIKSLVRSIRSSCREMNTDDNLYWSKPLEDLLSGHLDTICMLLNIIPNAICPWDYHYNSPTAVVPRTDVSGKSPFRRLFPNLWNWRRQLVIINLTSEGVSSEGKGKNQDAL